MTASMIETSNFVDELDSKLDELTMIEDVDNSEGYIFKPSDYALLIAKEIFRCIPNDLSLSLPEPKLVPDGEAGISITWKKEDREVNIGIFNSPKRSTFLYYMSDWDNDGGCVVATPENIVQRLYWLVTDNGC